MNYKKPSLLQALSLIFVLLLLVIYSVNMGISIIPALIISLIWALFIAYLCGYHWKEMSQLLWNRLGEVIEIFFVILAIGMFVASFIYSGTIPTIIYYLIELISPEFLIVLSFLITMIVSLIIGTSWGTVGTVGVIMIAIATSMNAPLPIVAGAIASGSHVGQLCSPMSDTSNVAASFAGCDTVSMIKRLAYYTIPVILISTVLYLFLGFNTTSTSVDLNSVALIRNEIDSVFNTSLLALIPMLFVMIMTLKKQPIVITLVLASFIALIFGVILNGFDIGKGLDAIYKGFSLESTLNLNSGDYSAVFDNLVNRGGALSMIDAGLLLLIASMYGCVLTSIDAVSVIATSLFARVKGRFMLTLSSIIVATLVIAMTSSSFLAAMMPKDLFLDKFRNEGMDGLDCVSSSVCASTQFLTCIPWCDTAIFIASISGVSTLAALPYNFFGYGCALMAIIMSIVGFGYANGKRLKREGK